MAAMLLVPLMTTPAAAQDERPDLEEREVKESLVASDWFDSLQCFLDTGLAQGIGTPLQATAVGLACTIAGNLPEPGDYVEYACGDRLIDHHTGSNRFEIVGNKNTQSAPCYGRYGRMFVNFVARGDIVFYRTPPYNTSPCFTNNLVLGSEGGNKWDTNVTRPSGTWASGYNTRVSRDNWSRVWRTYSIVFGRHPDTGGFNFWGAALENNQWNLVNMTEHFVASAEFNNTFGSLNDEQFVRRIYCTGLGREVDSGGLAFWLDQLNDGMSRGRMVANLAQSPEYKDETGVTYG